MSAFYFNQHQQQQQQQQQHQQQHQSQHQSSSGFLGSSSSSHTNNNNHHGGRSRRTPRLGTNSQNSHRQFRGVRSMKELAEVPHVSAWRTRFEMHRGFDFDDDLEFCPGLLTEDEISSYSSTSSDRSSLSSNSPTNSPLQHQVQPSSQQISPPFTLTSAYNNQQAYGSNGNHSQSHLSAHSQHHHHHQLKLHQPSAIRSNRNAIPIVNPSTGMRVASPPLSVSPGRATVQQAQVYGRRW